MGSNQVASHWVQKAVTVQWQLSQYLYTDVNLFIFLSLVHKKCIGIRIICSGLPQYQSMVNPGSAFLQCSTRPNKSFSIHVEYTASFDPLQLYLVQKFTRANCFKSAACPTQFLKSNCARQAKLMHLLHFIFL